MSALRGGNGDRWSGRERPLCAVDLPRETLSHRVPVFWYGNGLVMIDVGDDKCGHREPIRIGYAVEHPEKPIEGYLLDVMLRGFAGLEIENLDVVTLSCKEVNPAGESLSFC
jgi:hypothetical protein